MGLISRVSSRTYRKMDPAMMQQLLAQQQAQKPAGPPDSPEKIAVLNSIKKVSDVTTSIVKYGAVPFVIWVGMSQGHGPTPPGMPVPPPLSIWSLLPFL